MDGNGFYLLERLNYTKKSLIACEANLELPLKVIALA